LVAWRSRNAGWFDGGVFGLESVAKTVTIAGFIALARRKEREHAKDKKTTCPPSANARLRSANAPLIRLNERLI
jgi:hypothetical protein